MTQWPAQRWGVAALATVGALAVIGVPTGIIRTDLYTRMTPVTWWDYPIWLASSILAGLLVATYVRTVLPSPSDTGKLASGGLLSALAVGCPICNKVVVAAVGVSGALTLWAPLQPLLGLLSVALLGIAFAARLRGERRCLVGPAQLPRDRPPQG